jgi:hypothetical protein
MSRQYWQESLAWATSSGTGVTNTTTETILFPNVVIPANYMQDGRAIRLRAMGQWGIQAAANTFRIRVRFGGVSGVLAFDTGAITGSGGAVTTGQWDTDIVIQTRTNGSSGTVFAMGKATFGTATAPTIGTVANYGCEVVGSVGGVTSPAASAAIDLTADQALSLTCTWGTANASNTMTGHVYTIESLN